MITLRETIYHPDKETKISEQYFRNKNEMIRLIKRNIPIYSQKIYELTKRGETIIEYGGLKRKLEVIEEA